MNKEIEKNKKEIITFLIAVFLITYAMGTLMFFVFKKVDSDSNSSFAQVQMFYPALSSILLSIYYERDNINKKLHVFYRLYIALSLISILILILGVFFFQSKLSIILNISLAIFSIITITMIFMNKDGSFEKTNLVFNKNLKSVIKFACIFILLKLFLIMISQVVNGDLRELIKALLTTPLIVLLTPFYLGFTYLLFFGEEFGWRGYLQPRLQNVFGKKVGVIILGIIWGVWHLPLCIMLYSPSTPIKCIIYYVVFCTTIGIFIGFVYMRTNNLWSVILIHMINNSMIFDADSTYGTVITLKDLLFNSLLYIIVFVPFLFAKEYKDKKVIESCREDLI
ncbi:CPBP family intramembrane glutamic endopeptidase [Clostridium sp. YIM B02551]|uniref:CPBP family intramembrane glutamic endopeptidase n=1 Tax=Clostridium sp. YIM B02551 TaxID=2910679 RepID=UPI001EEA2A17|nr:CPBP family intramembrane glutamic endopeptidase [Clostridium sp. YIM B02551]